MDISNFWRLHNFVRLLSFWNFFSKRFAKIKTKIRVSLATLIFLRLEWKFFLLNEQRYKRPRNRAKFNDNV